MIKKQYSFCLLLICGMNIAYPISELTRKAIGISCMVGAVVASNNAYKAYLVRNAYMKTDPHTKKLFTISEKMTWGRGRQFVKNTKSRYINSKLKINAHLVGWSALTAACIGSGAYFLSSE